MQKTNSYYIEKYGGAVLGVLIGILLLLCNLTLSNFNDLIKSIPAIGTSAFGFLLTFLSIILQGNSETIIWIKSRKVLFARFIDFNKSVILTSLYLTGLSLFVGHMNNVLDVINCKYIILWAEKLLTAMTLGLFTKFIYDCMNLVKIFFNLIKQ